MRIGSLEAHGVPAQLLSVWEREYGQELLPLQEQAVVRHGVLAGKCLVVQAPTSAGKTFIGEMAGTRAALAGRKVLYLAPTRALAEDKYAHLSRLYGPLGLRVIVSTRDRRADDRRFTSGDFDLAVAVPEKVRALWARAGVSQFLGLAVIDEMQTMSEPERGPCLELLLAELRRLPGLQIIGLSACLGASPRLAHYLGAEWLETTERPVELRKGVMVGDCFNFSNAGRYEEERFEGAGPREGDNFARAAARLAGHLARRGEQTIVFVRDRATALHVAWAVAEGLGEAETAAHGLQGLERTAVREQLGRLMGQRVAFHSTDLQFEDRQAVEAAFRRGEVLVLCSTPTLALGVNLPARNVIIDPTGWHAEVAGAPSALSPIGRGDFENRAGRAGRLGHAESGRAFLLADSELSRGALASRYLEAQFEPPLPALESVPPLQLALHLAGGVHSGCGRTLTEVYRQTYTAYLREQRQLPEEVEEARALCEQRGLLRQQADGTLATTALGRIAATTGVSFETYCHLLEWVRRAERPPTELEATLVAAMAAEVQEALSWGRASAQDHGQALRSLAEELRQDGGLLEALLTSEQQEWRVRERAARATLALYRWLGAEETAEVEETTRLTAARLATLGETAGWLVETLSEIGAECGWGREQCLRLQRHAECLALGVDLEELPVARLRAYGLGRDHVRLLGRAGLQRPEEVRTAGLARLEELLPVEAARALWAALGEEAEPQAVREEVRVEVDVAVQAVTVCHADVDATSAEGPVLVLSEDRPDRAIIYGSDIALRPAEYRLLWTLAQSAGRCVRYERLYGEMWNGEAIAEPGQIYSHRSRLCSKLARALPHLDPKELLVTVPKHGLLLNLRREQVLVELSEAVA